MHWIATYLNPAFKDLLFVTDEAYLAEQKKSIKDDIYILANDCKGAILSTSELSHKTYSPPTKNTKEDPIATMRGAQTTSSSADTCRVKGSLFK